MKQNIDKYCVTLVLLFMSFFVILGCSNKEKNESALDLSQNSSFDVACGETKDIKIYLLNSKLEKDGINEELDKSLLAPSCPCFEIENIKKDVIYTEVTGKYSASNTEK